MCMSPRHRRAALTRTARLKPSNMCCATREPRELATPEAPDCRVPVAKVGSGCVTCEHRHQLVDLGTNGVHVKVSIVRVLKELPVNGEQ